MNDDFKYLRCMDLKEQIKSTGATFTPQGLADFLASEIVKYVETDTELTVLDPSCGDGELLLAINRVLENKRLNYSLHGFDTNQTYLDEANARLELIDPKKVRLEHGDFLELVDLSDEQ